MNLTREQVEIIISEAISNLGKPYSKDFDCVRFVRLVYEKAGIKIPLLKSHLPPNEWNISREQICDPPVGRLIFLKDPYDPRKNRSWTHVVIILTKQSCIHCSLFFGRRVVISTIGEILERYNFAEK
jgi:cell wall-associated NlpC family hydrolase